MSGCGKFRTLRLSGPLRLLVIAILFSGCGTTTVALKPTVDHLPGASKIPISVGVYYSPELRSYKYEVGSHLQWCKVGASLYVLPIGQASVILFERLFPVMFRNAITLETPPTAKSSESLVIEPDIENVECSTWPQGVNPLKFEITYHFTLYSSKGEASGYWNVTGRGEYQGGVFTDLETIIGNAADLAMEDAARNIATEFRDIPAVTRLLQEKR